MTAFSMDNLVKDYPQSKFKLNVKQFSGEEGSIMGPLGSNGAGKTSLLNLLLNITFPDAGTVTWSKNSIPTPDFIVRNVSYMPEYKNLYHKMSCGSILKFCSRAI